MLDDQDFRLKADECLSRLHSSLAAASDEHDFETDYGGALTVEFEDPPAKFVVSPNAPVRQIWVSAHSKSFKLAWDPGRSDFVLPESGQTLKELIEDALSRQLGESIKL
jgi:iron donor protein CyaY